MSFLNYRQFSSFDIEVFFLVDACLIYHTGTGQTHHLSGVAKDIFINIRNSLESSSFGVISQGVSNLAKPEDIVRTLESLLELYLIEKVT